jgi:hypothetical protein
MNEMIAFPQIAKKRRDNSSPRCSSKASTFKESYLRHLHIKFKSPFYSRLQIYNIGLAKLPKTLPPIKNALTPVFNNSQIQEKYEEIQQLFKKVTKT